MMIAFGQGVDDPGRREHGSGNTHFVAPAWHEANAIADFVRSGDIVVEAYIRAGLVRITPPEGMLPCLARMMTTRTRKYDASMEKWVEVGYARDRMLRDALVACWTRFASGPPTGWDTIKDRITLQSGLVLPSTEYQAWIKLFLDQGVSLERAYYLTGQSPILPTALMLCMESMMREGQSLTDAAMKCEKMPPVTLPIPNGNGNDVVNGKEDKKGIPVTYFVIGALAVGLAIASRR